MAAPLSLFPPKSLTHARICTHHRYSLYKLYFKLRMLTKLIFVIWDMASLSPCVTHQHAQHHTWCLAK